MYMFCEMSLRTSREISGSTGALVCEGVGSGCGVGAGAEGLIGFCARLPDCASMLLADTNTRREATARSDKVKGSVRRIKSLSFPSDTSISQKGKSKKEKGKERAKLLKRGFYI
jgi:hypothetical protein